MSFISRSPFINDASQISAGVITNTHINAAAAIAYSKLNLANSIVNADVAVAAAIAATKLSGLATQLLDDVELAAAAQSIATAVFTGKEVILIEFSGRLQNINGAGFDVIANLRFNNDSGANYSSRRNQSGTQGTSVSASSIPLSGAIGAIANLGIRKFEGFLFCADNSATREKYLVGEVNIFVEGTGAATAPVSQTMHAIWHNTAAQITRVDLVHLHLATDAEYEVGTRIRVTGEDVS